MATLKFNEYVVDENKENQIKKLIGTKFKYNPIEYDKKNFNKDSETPIKKGPHHKAEDNPNLPITQAIEEQEDLDSMIYHPNTKMKNEELDSVKNFMEFSNKIKPVICPMCQGEEKINCSECGGSGEINGKDCEKCKGTGYEYCVCTKAQIEESVMTFVKFLECNVVKDPTIGEPKIKEPKIKDPTTKKDTKLKKEEIKENIKSFDKFFE